MLDRLKLRDQPSAPLLLLLAAIWLAFTAGVRPLLLPDEGRYVGVAWEMLQAGDWSVPLLDGMPFFHKPPLFYWITALGLEVFGANVWAGRLASLLGAWLAVAGLYLFLRRYRGSEVATVAAVILATQPFFFGAAQYANLDMLVAGMISLTILAGADAVLRREQGRAYKPMLLAAYALAALGVLAKGLIGMVLPGGALLLWLLATRRFRAILAVLWLPAVALFFALALPWFALMQQRYPGFYDYFVIYHHFQRFSQTGFNNAHPFWFYIPVILLLTLPWSPWLWRSVRREERRAHDPQGIRLLLGLWLLTIVGFFSLPASKLVGYVLPALPPLAGLLALSFVRWFCQPAPNRSRLAYGASIALAGVICVGAILALTQYRGHSARPLAGQLASQFQTGDQLVMLDSYQYDLPFYLQLAQPAWVVSDWNGAQIVKNDDWRKELYDAGLFDTASMQRNLISAAEFERRVCAAGGEKRIWVWGSREQAAKSTLLRDLPPLMQASSKRGDQLIWRLDRPLPACGGMPKAG